MSLRSDSSEADRIAGLQEPLLHLKSGDMGDRLAAFDLLRSVPRELIAPAYARFRQMTPAPGSALDCFERLEVVFPSPPIRCERCICAVVSPGYESMLEAMLDSLGPFVQRSTTKVVVFAVDASYDVLERRRDINRIRCRSIERLSTAVKGILYSAATFIDAQQFLALEPDMLVVGDLTPLWAALDVAQTDRILGVRSPGRRTVAEMLGRDHLNARLSDLGLLTGMPGFDCPYWFNGGVIAGSRMAFLALERQLRRLSPISLLWIEGGSPRHFAEEFLLNLSVGIRDSAAELHPAFNLQFRSPQRDDSVRTEIRPDGVRYRCLDGVPARILHFLSPNRHFQWEIKAEVDAFGLAPSSLQAEAAL